MKPVVVGFTGKMRSGKTTACNYITNNHDNFVRIGFTEALNAEIKQNFAPLLEEIRQVYNLTEEELFLTKPPLLRRLQQCYGTEVRRNDDPNYWVKKWKEIVEERLAEGKSVLCDNVRFLNEAEAIKSMQGTIIRIVRTDITDTGSHQSETEMDSITPDLTIKVGKGELEKLYGYLKGVIAL